ncbi:hypothetical protein SOCE26_074940 [Sorangium cellulosum]|uniref:Uncharacterized protein n=1 Tax=Sorangium cellulosum TaxID=56 RepID=A0A2L0F3B2_SORCE|nr:hypothetical protein [Sorangium cellulosum]AUX45991.1 hypothetical protein SOCE26_074940 [Sorangium cellulosum]
MSLARLGFMPVLGLLSLLSVGCGDDPPPPPRGAFRMNFADPGGDCSTAGHLAELGSVTGTHKDQVLADGEEDVTVSCTVSGSGSFSVSARATNAKTAASITVSIGSIAPDATQDAPATGSVNFSSVQTAGDTFVASPEPCNFWFIPESGQGVDAGKIWVAFECPAVRNEGQVCQIRNGFLAFDNCDT